MGFGISLTITDNCDLYSFPNIVVDWIDGSENTFTNQQGPTGWVDSISGWSPTTHAGGKVPPLSAQGTLVIYLIDSTNTYVYAFQFVWQNDSSDYFNYGYWGWPKQQQDAINWMNSDGATYYTNDGPYTFSPNPEGGGSAPGMTVSVNLTSNANTVATITFSAIASSEATIAPTKAVSHVIETVSKSDPGKS